MNENAATVFIAEDNPILLQGLGRALTANGYAVSTAEDGPSVLNLLSSSPRPPDLLLLDVMMPGMTGFEVLQAVHTEPRWSEVPVMLITAATDETLSTSAMRNGAVDVLIKPFRLNELLERIAVHIRREPDGAAAPVAPLVTHDP